MRTLRILLMSVLALAWLPAVCQQTPEQGRNGNQPRAQQDALLQQLRANPAAPMTEAERLGLVRMIEEVQASRDFYLKINEEWEFNVFAAIAEHEQTHVDLLAAVANKYKLDAPLHNKPGMYVNGLVQARYDSLHRAGLVNFREGIRSAAFEEETALATLQRLRKAAVNPDLVLVYDEGLRCTRNELRQIWETLDRLGYTYTPKKITRAQWDEIVQSPMETGPVQ